MSEFMPENDVIIAKTVDESAPAGSGSTAEKNNALVAAPKPPIDLGKKTKKKRSVFGIFKAALFLLRNRRPMEKWAKKTVTKETTKSSSSAHWKKLVGSMRPLRLPEASRSPPPALNDIEEMIPPQEQQQPPPPAAIESIEEIPAAVIESIEEIRPASPAVSCSGTMSQYSSAVNLRDLDVTDDESSEEDPDEVFDAITGDEMIDAKAEEFIAQFYRQIHLQNTTSTNHHHHKRI
ncbi:hypothetical protein Salat_2220700 [Sesamum alatum]|uniref:Uncharacterized protein n=1 Tax=Sesamum alatum TaxID=300844 RepID=A0AAE1XU35_9LAMI|nr:hypothetical protein Salat_2220700 [Sesamum alatum]